MNRPQYRTTVIGSFPKVADSRADNLPGVIDRWQKKLVGDDALEQELQKVIRRVIGEQEQAGLDLITDGQIRWEDLAHPIARSASGIQRGTLRRFFDNNVYYRRLEWKNGVSWKRSAVAEEFKFASGVAKRPVKVALPGPLTLVISTEPQPGQTREQLLSAYEGILRKEVEALEKAGVQEIQLDEPALAPGEPLAAQAAAAISRIFQGIRARRWVASYFQDTAALIPVLTDLQVDVLALDLVSAREKVADLVSKTAARMTGGVWKGEVALGLVDARNTRMEDPEEIRGRVGLFAKVIPPERMWISPNCGLEFLPHASAVKKLTLLHEVARGV